MAYQESLERIQKEDTIPCRLEMEDRLEKLEKEISKLVDRSKKWDRLDEIVNSQKVLQVRLEAFNKDFEDFRDKFNNAAKDMVQMGKTFVLGAG